MNFTTDDDLLPGYSDHRFVPFKFKNSGVVRNRLAQNAKILTLSLRMESHHQHHKTNFKKLKKHKKLPTFCVFCKV